ncbi:MAG TPA: phosphatidylglycerol lysyltransferase domain-containing protein [Geobacteraceae bacterium]|nr:phosphatidylglycerol lysyltransferase domain-containing protein [Geobacteraceae bacterium]
MDIPHHPDNRPITLEDKSLLDGIFAEIQPRISEFTFANIFLFRRAHDYRITKVGEAIVIIGQGYDRVPYFLPPLGGDIDDALAILFNSGMMLYGADERFAGTHLKRNGVDLVEDRDNFDYLYLRHDLADLPGNRFHKKKNRINYFSSRHDYETEIIGEKHLDGCLELLAEWMRVRGGLESASLMLEAEATDEALKLAVPLGLEGVIVLVDGKVKAFSLGERLNSGTSVCHFEKADPFLEGLYQLVDREFSRVLFTDCTHINREQDLGIMNLRESKLSYHPVELIRKFRARPRER